MEYTSSQSLPYPEPEDFANGSQQLKMLAEAIDLRLSILDLGYDAILARPVVLKTVTPGVQTISASINTTVNIPNTTFQSSEFTAQSSSTSIDFSSYPAGIWMGGVYLGTNPVGAVNTGNHRNVTLRVVDRRIQPGTGVSVYEELWDESGCQSNTGGDFTTFSQTFEIHDPDNAFIQMRLHHGNVSSALSVTAGFVWALYIGELAN
ncbi:MAG: hypothetical protein EHM35_06000 [Planctomycetaceae bacterium]|nr:MAG: hypothetical protein EHM35_06000 [Planctomycetaceae bacterium]